MSAFLIKKKAAFAPHGRGVVMTGAAQTGPEIAFKLNEEFLKQIQNNPDLTIMIGYEYFGQEKLRTIAQDATAFHGRQSPSNIMLQAVFDGKAPNLKEIEQRARAVLNDLKRIAMDDSPAPPYGNYDDGNSLEFIPHTLIDLWDFRGARPRSPDLGK
jgi:hypothetical protein